VSARDAAHISGVGASPSASPPLARIPRRLTHAVRSALAVCGLALIAYAVWLGWGPAPSGAVPVALDWLLYTGPFVVGARRA
jgi:hypothetical protein